MCLSSQIISKLFFNHKPYSVSYLQIVEEGDAPAEQLKGKVVKFGWLDGVYVRKYFICLTFDSG